MGLIERVGPINHTAMLETTFLRIFSLRHTHTCSLSLFVALPSFIFSRLPWQSYASLNIGCRPIFTVIRNKDSAMARHLADGSIKSAAAHLRKATPRSTLASHKAQSSLIHNGIFTSCSKKARPNFCAMLNSPCWHFRIWNPLSGNPCLNLRFPIEKELHFAPAIA